MSRGKRLVTVALLLGLVSGFSGCVQKKVVENPPVVSEAVRQTAPFKAFNASYEGKDIKCLAEGDINADGQKDLIVIFAASKEEMNTVAVYSAEGGVWRLTEPVKAPYEKQRIELKNIDSKGPAEMIISGSRKTHFGMAIFRLEGGKLVDLFNDGMEDCC